MPDIVWADKLYEGGGGVRWNRFLVIEDRFNLDQTLLFLALLHIKVKVTDD